MILVMLPIICGKKLVQNIITLHLNSICRVMQGTLIKTNTTVGESGV